jgi:MiaB-like tRNA modifying enzyme
MNNLKNSDKTIIVTGCLSQAEPDLLRKRYPSFHILGVNAYNFIPNILNSDTMNQLPVLNVSAGRSIDEWIEKPLLDSTQWNNHRNIIQINEGCVNSCTFCATKNARGRLKSFNKESIVSAIRRLATPEVWLTSQDTACWGFDFNDSIISLIKNIDQIERKFWLRLGMGNPNNFIKLIDNLVDLYRSDKMYKFIHIPIQAGSNNVLKHMKRGYVVEEYEEIVLKLRDAFPDITVSTDVICGYPTETEDDFKETIRTINKTRPSITNVSRYWERRGTSAAELKQIPHEERKRRSGIMSKITKKIQLEDNKKWIGWQGEALLIEKGSKGGIQARNKSYKPIIINETFDLLGKWHNVEITGVYETYFEGRLVH